MKAKHLSAPVLLFCLFLTSCVGPQARKTFLTPNLQLAWSNLKDHAEQGGADPASIQSFTDALNSNNHQQIYIQWPGIQTAAENFIETRVADGVMGAGKAGAARERIVNFDEAIELLNRRFTR